MRILLTGACGYIGSHILRELLESGHTVSAVVRSPGKLEPLAAEPGLAILKADLEDHARLAGLPSGHEVCVHAALLWGEPGSEHELRDTAVAARLFEAAGSAGVARGLYLSSAAVHRPFAAEMSEDDPLGPADLQRDPYAATKAAGEQALRSACAAHGMTGVVLRPGPAVGPPAFAGASLRTPNPIAEMVRAAAAGHPLSFTRGEGRQLSDVAAVARAVRLVIDEENPHPTYVCVDRDLLPWEQIARMVVAGLDSPSEVRVLPRDTTGPIPRFDTGRIEGLLGGPCPAAGALREHIHHLAHAGGRNKEGES